MLQFKFEGLQNNRRCSGIATRPDDYGSGADLQKEVVQQSRNALAIAPGGDMAAMRADLAKFGQPTSGSLPVGA